MKFRGIMVASPSGSHLLKRASDAHLWKRAYTTVATLVVKADTYVPSGDQASFSTRGEKRKMLEKLRNLKEAGGTVEETLNASFEERAFITQADLLRWAKRLDKEGKHQQALEMFEWMEGKKMTFSPSQLATFVELIAKTKGFDAAEDYCHKVDPNFTTGGLSCKNWRCQKKLLDIIYRNAVFRNGALYFRSPTEPMDDN